MKVKGEVFKEDFTDRYVYWYKLKTKKDGKDSLAILNYDRHSAHELAKVAAEKFADEHGFKIEWEGE